MARLSDKEKKAVLKHLENGLTLKRILRKLDLRAYEIQKERELDQEFGAQYKIAWDIGTETQADELDEIHETIKDTPKAKLASDNRKWLLSKRVSHRYGDKVTHEFNHNVNLKIALEDADNRFNTALNALKDVSAELIPEGKGSSNPLVLDTVVRPEEIVVQSSSQITGEERSLDGLMDKEAKCDISDLSGEKQGN